MEARREMEQLYLYQTNQTLKGKGRNKGQRWTLHNDQSQVQEEGCKICNYAPNVEAPKYVNKY